MKKIRLFPRGLWQVGLRYLLAHRWQSLLMVLGISIGVAVIVAIDLANASASQAFDLSRQLVAGRTTHQIIGSGQQIPESVYSSLQTSEIAGDKAPIISIFVSSPQMGEIAFELLGVDVFVDGAFRNYVNSGTDIPLDQLIPFLTQPGAVMVSQSTAERYGLRRGDQIQLTIEGKVAAAVIAGILNNPEDRFAARALEGIIVADIATAQELSGRVGYLDRIDLIAPDNVSLAEWLASIEKLLPDGLVLQAGANRDMYLEEMTSAFKLNLSALSLLALVVGLFLIYNTMTFSVIQRRPLFGMLRCLGVTRVELSLLIVSEAFLIGIIGTLFGLALGILMGRQTIQLVSQTINDLYYTTTVQSAGLPAVSLVKGTMVGIAATVITALFPAWEAANSPARMALSRSSLEGKARSAVYMSAAAGILLIGASLLVFKYLPADIYFGFGGLFASIVGIAMLSALVMILIILIIGPFLSRALGLLGRLAPRNIINSLSRTSVAVVALMVAVAVAIGMGLMINSFRYTVQVWLSQTLTGDIFISAPTFLMSTPRIGIDPQVLDAANQLEGLEDIYYLRSTIVETNLGPVNLSASSNPNILYERLLKDLDLTEEQAWQEMLDDGVMISESLESRLGITTGDRIDLITPEGLRTFRILGTYYDYTSSEGLVLMAAPRFQALWQDDTVTAVALHLADGYDADERTQALQEAAAGFQQTRIVSNQGLKEDVLEIFDRTFAITSALRLLATVVAFIGVLNSLLLLQLEKQRDLGILRALGLTGRQMWSLVMLETGLMGFVAGLIAIPTGYTLAVILINIINQRSFGWTLQLYLGKVPFLEGMIIAVSAALLAGIYPAIRLGRMTTAEAIRYE